MNGVAQERIHESKGEESTLLSKKRAREELAAQPSGDISAEYENVKRSRTIFSYYLPVILVAMVVTAVFTWSTSWLSSRAAGERLDRLARTLAHAVQLQVADRVKDRVRMLSLLAARPDVARALAQGGDLSALRQLAVHALPGATRVEPIPTGWHDQQLLEAVSGSFAAAEMYRSVAKKGKIPPAQVVRDQSGRMEMLVAAPVTLEGKTVGALLAVFPIDALRKEMQALGLQESYVALEQSYKGTALPLASSGKARPTASEAFPVPGTLWRVRYAPPATSGISWLLLLALVAGGALLLFAVTLFGYRRLAHDCKADMGMMVALVDATLKRTGAATPVPHLLEAKPALELLARYAQATFTAQKSGEGAAAFRRRKEKEGMVVEEEEGGSTEASEAAAAVPALEEEHLPPSLFQGGLIRGRSGMELSEEVCQAVGLAVGSMVIEAGGGQMVVGRDNRATSDSFASALAAGLLASGCDVIDLGEVPAPLVNYAIHSSAATSGVMVTGGHNPPEYNGFKIYIDGQPLSEEDLLELRHRILEGRFRHGTGRLESRDVSREYLEHVTTDVQLLEPLKLVVDGGNGVAGPLARRLFEALGCEVIPLFCEPDGGFPNHLPDPSDESNLQALAQEVGAQGAHLGVAFDMDGDALALVDEQGRVVPPDILLMALAADVIRRQPGADVIYDVASTAKLPEFILANGGRPIMWRTGHAEIQAKLKESQGLLAGEFSGHIYIKDRWYGFDDAFYTAARVLELISLDAASVSAFFEAYGTGMVATPLLALETPPGKAEEVVRQITVKGEFDDADVIDLDGLRLEYEKAWGLVRASHTRPALLFRFEAQDEAALAEVQQRFRDLLRDAAPELQAPF